MAKSPDRLDVRRVNGKELKELLETTPRPYKGVNLWLLFMERLAKGEADCIGIFFFVDFKTP